VSAFEARHANTLRQGDLVTVIECRGPIPEPPVIDAVVTATFVCRRHVCRHPLQLALHDLVFTERPR
jgi:hypothetical protein